MTTPKQTPVSSGTKSTAMTKEEILTAYQDLRPKVYSHKQAVRSMQEYATQEKQGWVSKLEELSNEITDIRVKASDTTMDRMLYDLDIKICKMIDELQNPEV